MANPSPVIWGVHNDQPQLDIVDNGFVSIGWSRLGDLSVVGDDRDVMKARLAATFPDYKPRAIPVAAGMLLAFAFRMQPGDLVVYPHKPDRTLNFGRIHSDYYFEPAGQPHPHRRSVRWLQTGVPRTMFSQGARNEASAFMTVFKVRRHAHEFLDFIRDAVPPG